VDDDKKRYRLNDLGNAQRFIDILGENLRYVHDWKTWMHWQPPVWLPDRVGIAQEIAKEVGSMIRESAKTVEEELDDEGLGKEERKNLEAIYKKTMKAADKAETMAGIKSMLWLAQSDTRVSMLARQLDSDPNRFNTFSGTINLLDGELEPHDPENYFTQTAHRQATYEPGTECPTWHDTLNLIFNHNKEVIDYVQRAVGYSMTGDNSEQCIFYCYGTGANGKSVFLNTLRKMFHDYACQAMPGTFDSRGSKRAIREDLARLRGKRLVITTETKKGEALDAETVKMMTGGDTMVAKNIYERPFEFDPQFKVWFAANTQMPIPEATHGMWRRIFAIYFGVKIPKEKQEKYETIMAKLQHEFPGIMQWAIEGLIQWRIQGLNPPEAVLKATAAYKADQDRIGEFLETHCDTGKGKSVALKDLYDEYKRWCEDTGDHRLGKQRFNSELKERDMKSEKRGGNMLHILGIDLKPMMKVINGGRDSYPSEGEWEQDEADGLPF